MKTKWHNVKLTEKQIEITMAALSTHLHIIWDNINDGHDTQVSADRVNSIVIKLNNLIKKY